ncbi:hypothetical protein M409DRAFT_66285 [Zasmidium cellare ATCC 36951]|uniref:N-acetyltransferase domain-containing protein n=1 Tax=Zasmidium cellare ATCC 36951 TaxID=1080233 RepID=A0A6A6CMY1_ZASCE|nr:uncharacterized protein M409DRAFT_66285 [Zasmidium cellare ATCC 36951]KAF2167282.1 hypothetical protein M409DRAFT_66285 [Zasmidium cellare ATCC 36951]
MANQIHPFRSKRLLYRAIEPSEDEDFFLAIQQDAFGYRNSNITIPKPQSRKDAQHFMKVLVENQLLAVVICLPPENPANDQEEPSKKPTPIGAIHLSSSKPTTAHHRFADIGIDVLPSYQGKGYGSEAIRWILEWGFETAGLHRVGIRCFGYNEGARKLYNRLGFKEESVVRELLFHRGRWWDDVGFGMLEGEWRGMKEKEMVGGAE